MTPVNPIMTPKQKFIYREMNEYWVSEIAISLLLRRPEADLTNTLRSMVRKGFLETNVGIITYGVRSFRKLIK